MGFLREARSKPAISDPDKAVDLTMANRVSCAAPHPRRKP